MVAAMAPMLTAWRLWPLFGLATYGAIITDKASLPSHQVSGHRRLHPDGKEASNGGGQPIKQDDCPAGGSAERHTNEDSELRPAGRMQHNGATM